MSQAVQIAAMLNWYDEEPKELARVVSDVYRLGARTLIAVDGAYANFPGGKAHSPTNQHNALFRACDHVGISLLDFVPRDVWLGDEVAKRQMMLELAAVLNHHWLLVYDADYDLIQCDIELPELLTKLDDEGVMGLDVRFTTAPHTRAGDHRARLFMAHRPGMEMGSNHYTYVYPDGQVSKILTKDSTAPGKECDAIRVFHRHCERSAERHAAQAMYYKTRDEHNLERP